MIMTIIVTLLVLLGGCFGFCRAAIGILRKRPMEDVAEDFIQGLIFYSIIFAYFIN